MVAIKNIRSPKKTSDRELAQITEIEASFDEANRALFELKKSSAKGADVKLWNLYELLWDKKFKILFKECERLFIETEDTNTKAFIIQAAVAASEILFDLQLRKKWLRLWNYLDDYLNTPYAQYLYLCHRGNTFYFEGNLPESIKQWNKALGICNSIHYVRGIFRLQYFIGKAYSDLGFLGQAHIYYNNSLSLAHSVNALRFVERIQVQLNKGLGAKQYLCMQMQLNVFDLIKDNKLKKAKKLTLFYCRCRRDEKRQWGAESEWILLAWMALAEKKTKRFFYILDFMDSDHTKWIVLKTSEELNPYLWSSDSRFKHHLNLLSDVKCETINRLSDNLSDKQTALNEADLETKKFIQFLKEIPEGLLKEDICRKLWNYEYDPVIHDQRIYMLISKTRKFFGSKNSIINSYGGLYKINKLLI